MFFMHDKIETEMGVNVLMVVSLPHITSSLSACATSSISVYYIPYSETYSFGIGTKTIS